jgi:hypothetical protein
VLVFFVKIIELQAFFRADLKASEDTAASNDSDGAQYGSKVFVRSFHLGIFNDDV